MFTGLGFKYEPALITEAIRQILFALVAVGVLHFTEQQNLAIIAAVSAVLALFTRQSVITENTLRKAGTSGQEIIAEARSREQLR